jgi:hypothetical protein
LSLERLAYPPALLPYVSQVPRTPGHLPDIRPGRMLDAMTYRGAALGEFFALAALESDPEANVYART